MPKKSTSWPGASMFAGCCGITSWVDDYVKWAKDNKEDVDEAKLIQHEFKLPSIFARSLLLPFANLVVYFLMFALFSAPDLLAAKAISPTANLIVVVLQTMVLYVLYTASTQIVGGIMPNIVVMLCAPWWCMLRAPAGKKCQYFGAALLLFSWYGGLDLAFVYAAGAWNVWMFGSSNLAVVAFDETADGISQQNMLILLGAVFVIQTAVMWMVALGFADSDGAWLPQTKISKSRWRISKANEMIARMNSLFYPFLVLTCGLNFPPDPQYLMGSYLATLDSDSYALYFELILPTIAITSFVFAVLGGLLSVHVFGATRWFSSSSEPRGGRSSDIEMTKKGGDDDDEEEEADSDNEA